MKTKIFIGIKRAAALLCAVCTALLLLPALPLAAADECKTAVEDGSLDYDAGYGLTRFSVTADEELDADTVTAAGIYMGEIAAARAELAAADKLTVYFDAVIQRNSDYTVTFDDSIKTVSGRTLAAAELDRGMTVLSDKNDDFSLCTKSGGVSLRTLGTSGDIEKKVFSAAANSNTDGGDYVIYKTDGDVTEFSFWTYVWGSYTLADGSGSTLEGDFSVWASEDGAEYTRLTADQCGRKGWYTVKDRFPSGAYSWCSVKKIASLAELPVGVRYLKIVFPRVRSGMTTGGSVQSGVAMVGDVEITHFGSGNTARIAALGDVAAADNLELHLGTAQSSLDGAEFCINGQKVTARLENGGKSVRLSFGVPLEANSNYALTVHGALDIEPRSRYIGFHTAYSRDSEGYVWDSVNIGGGGMVTGLIFHPTEPNLLYARTDVGGVYRRDYEKDQWIPLMDEFKIEDWNSFSVNGFCIDPSDPDVIYAACGGVWYTAGRVYKSTDRGKTWKKLPLAPLFIANDGRLDGECIAVDPADSDTVYCGTAYEGLFVSHDGGESWANVVSVPTTEKKPTTQEEYNTSKGIGIRSVYFMPRDGGYTICASVYGKGIYASTDGGASWRLLEGSPTRARRMTAYRGKLYVSCRIDADSGFDDGLYCYDGGKWESAAPQSGIEMNGITAGRVGGRDILYCAANKGSKLFVKEEDGEWQTVFSGNTTDYNDVEEHMPWITMHAKKWGGAMGSYVGGLALNPNGGDRAELWLGDGWSVWCNPDAMNDRVFYAECKNLEETVVNTVCAPPGGDTLLITGIYDYGGLRHSADNAEGVDANAQTTDKIYTSDPVREDAFIWGTSLTSADYCAGDTRFMAHFTDTYKNGVSSDNAGSFGVVALSEDYGATWNKYGWVQDGSFYGGCVAVGAEVGSNGYPTVIAIQKSDGSSTAYAKRSTDFGRTWTNIQSLPTNLISGSYQKNRNIIAADRVNGNKFYVFDKRNGDFYYSHDGGASFTRSADKVTLVSQGGAPSDEYLNNDIEANPNAEGDVVFLSYANGLFRSTDSGRTIKKVEGPTRVAGFSWGAETDEGITSAFVLATVDGRRGIYRSDDNLKTWIYAANADMGLGCMATCIEGDKRVFGRVYVGTSGRGVLYADTAVKSVTFIDDKSDSDWLIMNGANKMGMNDTTWRGWYATSYDKESSEIIFAFDGSKSKVQGNHRYRLNGRLERLSFIAAGYGGSYPDNIEIQISADGEVWRSIGTAAEIGKAFKSDELPSWMSCRKVTLSRAQLGTSAAYVRLLMKKNNGIALPEVTYAAEEESYEINDVALTRNEDGTATADGRVYFNRDGSRETAAFTVFAAAYKDGVLTDAAAERFENVARGGFAEFKKTVRAESGTTVGIFAFESAENPIPLAVPEKRVLK